MAETIIFNRCRRALHRSRPKVWYRGSAPICSVAGKAH